MGRATFTSGGNDSVWLVVATVGVLVVFVWLAVKTFADRNGR
jgi:hypothetical protein